MIYTENEILQYIDENDVKFVKLTFCDINGNLKNISVLSSELATVFEHGLKINSSKIEGFAAKEGKALYLFPDASTMTMLPWRPQQGRVIRLFCYIFYADGSRYEGDGRYFLKKAVKAALDKGFCFRFGTSCEFMLFCTDDNGLPTTVRHDMAGYCDSAPYDKGENIRRDICLTLEQMNIHPLSSYHEDGCGQHEIDFNASSALRAADTFMSFKSAVKSVSQRNNVYASFMPKPDKNDCSNGMKIAMNIIKDDDFFDVSSNKSEIQMQNAIAGIIKRLKEISLFTNPLINSYSRLAENGLPRKIAWSDSENTLAAVFSDEDSPVILRTPDCAGNPYYIFGLLIYAALEGLENKYELPEKLNTDSQTEEMPGNLEEAIEAARQSEFLARYIHSGILDEYVKIKKSVWDEYSDSADKEAFEFRKYFYSV
ncbi:MAG: glutamine synthetase family protein [Oscillospiraceae bacterium]|nr:glutamine synthetase family protein [Oscillospiraceae bacterium]